MRFGRSSAVHLAVVATTEWSTVGETFADAARQYLADHATQFSPVEERNGEPV